MNRNPLIVAIDTDNLAKAINLAIAVQPHCFGLKFGLEFFYAHGARGIHAVLDAVARVEYVDGGRQHAVPHMPYMLDLKLHDIPTTVGKTVARLAMNNPWAITVHAAGGTHMMRAAVEAAASPDPYLYGVRILAVTVLTSSLVNDFDVRVQAEHYARNAREANVDGVVCSALEAAPLRRVMGVNSTIVCPGIRLTQDGETEQVRIATPHQAIQQGANYIVVGRPITQAVNPGEAARLIAAAAVS